MGKDAPLPEGKQTMPRDFFLSYAPSDESWALWIADQLEQAGYSVFVSAWDIRPGHNRVFNIDQALWQSQRTLVILTDAFLQTASTQPEWTANFVADPTGVQQRLLPILIGPCQVHGLLATLECLNLSGLEEDEARKHLLAGVIPGRVRPPTPMLFPGSSVRVPFPGRTHIFQPPALPEGYVPRPGAFGQMKRLILERQEGQMAAITTALRGTGGFGKTILALALCHDSEIQAAFPDGILWVALGEQPGRAVDILNGWLAALETPHYPAPTLEEARDRLRAALQDRVCLLVIDDVWQRSTLLPLLEGGPQCARLITTRDDQVLPQEARRITVDVMEPSEAVAMLTRGLPGESQQPEIQARLQSLATRLGCWPLLLTLTHGSLLNQIHYGRSLVQALEKIEEAYEKGGITTFHLDQVDVRHSSVEACVEVSLHQLEEFTRVHYQATERYHELAVFPEDTDIPIATLQRYWRGTGGLEALETEELCVRMHRLSLLLTCDLGKGTIRLHDVLRSYLRQRVGEKLLALQDHFLHTQQSALKLKRWADIQPEETYLWQRLIWHLCQARRWEELHSTLTDVRFLAKKIFVHGMAALEADVSFAWNEVGHWQERYDSVPVTALWPVLQRRLGQISHLVRQVHTVSEIGGVLLAYLGWDTVLSNQPQQASSLFAPPFLTAWHRLPDKSSSALHRTLTGHTGTINACVFSPDSRWIASASDDQTLKVWDITSGTMRITLTGHIEKVNACAFSPDGRLIVSASDDQTLKVWDIGSHSERLSLAGHTQKVNACAFSPDGLLIISASDDQTLRVWDALSGSLCLSLTGHTGKVHSCSFSPDGQFVLSTSSDGALMVWNTSTGSLRSSFFAGHPACAFSMDGGSMVTISVDKTSRSREKTLKIWDIAQGKERHSFFLSGRTTKINACAFSPDGRWLVFASDDKTLKIMDALSGAERFSLKGHTDTITACAFSPDGRWIVSAADDQTLKVWDALCGIERVLVEQTPRFTFVASSLNRRWSAYGGAASTITLRGNGRDHYTERFSLSGHTARVRACAFSFDGRSLISASQDGMLKVWDIASKTERFSLIGHTKKITTWAFSFDGLWMASASEDQTLRVWDLSSGDACCTFIGHTAKIIACAFSFDGHSIVSASTDGILKVWDASSGIERLSCITDPLKEITACALSFDGRRVISASNDKILKFWDSASGTKLLSFMTNHFSEIIACAFSPDGRWIVSVSHDKNGGNTLKVWDAASGKECSPLADEYPTPLTAWALGPRGRTLVSADGDGTLQLWDTDSGKKRRTLINHDEVDKMIMYGVFHEGPHTLTGLKDLAGIIRAWKMASDNDSRPTFADLKDLVRIIRDTASGKYNSEDEGLHIRAITLCVFSPNGRAIVTDSNDSTFWIWDTSSRRKYRIIPVDTDQINCCAFSPDGRTLVFASDYDNEFKILDTSSWEERFSFTGHPTPVTACAFSPDGRFIVTAPHDAPLKVWDASSRTEHFSFPGHPEIWEYDGEFIADGTYKVTACTFSPDGRSIITAAEDKMLKVCPRCFAIALPCGICRQEATHGVYRNCWGMKEWLRFGSMCAGMSRCFRSRHRKKPKERESVWFLERRRWEVSPHDDIY